MFSKSKSIIKSRTIELTNLVEGTDVFNSKFIYMLRRLPEKGRELVAVRQGRIDLISESIYGDTKYSDVLLLYNGITLKELLPNLEIKYPSIEDINSLLTKLTTILNPRQFKSSNI